MNFRYFWCTYRDWSFALLEAILKIEGAECLGVLTTKDCVYDFSYIESSGVKIIRDDPILAMQKNSVFFKLVESVSPDCCFFYGWSWIIPAPFHGNHLSVTLHPGKLPNDKGGSPLQNQIRNGEKWSFANIIKINDQLDAGPIYGRERFSLQGNMDDVWNRMIATGAFLTYSFIKAYPKSTYSPLANGKGGTIYKRVKSIQAEIKPDEMDANEIYNIIRGHNENDPNSYVAKANLRWHDMKLLFLAATLYPDSLEIVTLDTLNSDFIYKAIHTINNDIAYLRLEGRDGNSVYISRLRIQN